MLVPLEWLREYTDVDADTDTFCERMVMSGSNIETVRVYGEGIENVVIGKVLSVEKHEDSDHLVVTRTDVGDGEPLQIVTGADNVRAGDIVPVALVGSVLPGGVKIKKGKLRGVASEGMLCSASELGFDDKVIPVAHKDGIWILNGAYTPGDDFVRVYGLRETVVDFEITPNRPDCLSVVGMARETAATFGGKLVYPSEKPYRAGEGNGEDRIAVEIAKPELCARYIARLITDVRIEPSPPWMQKRLMAAGMRPINNMVDITNYVMLEYGHPLHAFDVRTVAGGRIVVDTASEGELFTTLDGNERRLFADTLMIRDAEKAIGIAGIMGGENSEIKDDTRTILIESAAFRGDVLRLSSKKLGLRTEASSRYEKGIDPELTARAMNRVCALAEMIGAGKPADDATDVYPGRSERVPVRLRVSRVNKVLGTALTRETVADCLERLEMQTSGTGDEIEAFPPFVRVDIAAEEDLIEEVARIYGYDRLAPAIPKNAGRAETPRPRVLRDLARDVLTAAGYDEIQTYSFVSPRNADRIGASEDAKERRFVRLRNPLGEENSVLRTALLPGLLETLGRNRARNNAEAAVFEVGNTFFAMPNGGLPEERISLALGAYGDGVDFRRVKGVVANLLMKLGVTVSYEAETGASAYHPGRCARLVADGETRGVFGELHPDVAEDYGIDGRCYAGELDFHALAAAADVSRAYSPLPRYPAIERDIALLVKEPVTVKEIEDVIREVAGGEKGLLESVGLFDVYRGRQVAPGFKSAAFNLVYRSEARTLTDEEVAVPHGKVLKALETRLGAVLRD